MQPDEQNREKTQSAQEDISLIQRFLGGDDAAFETLYYKYQQPLYALCRQVLGNDAEAEDAQQEAWLDIYAGLRRFRGDAQFITWAYRIAVRRCLERAKKMNHHASIDNAEPAQPDRQQALVDSVVVQEALTRLPAGSRLMLVLRFFREFSYQEIAAVTGSTVMMVKIPPASGKATAQAGARRHGERRRAALPGTAGGIATTACERHSGVGTVCAFYAKAAAAGSPHRALTAKSGDRHEFSMNSFLSFGRRTRKIRASPRFSLTIIPLIFHGRGFPPAGLPGG